MSTYTHTHTHSYSTWTQTTELVRDRFMWPICFGSQPRPCPCFFSPLLPSLPLLCVWTCCHLPACCFLAAGLVTYCRASPESRLFISVPPRQWSSRVQALLWLNWWNVRPLMRFSGVCACAFNVFVCTVSVHVFIVILCVNISLAECLLIELVLIYEL